MDWLTFIAEIIKAIAWPITVIVIFLMLRRPILRLFPLVQRLRFQGVELDFRRELQGLALEMERELPPESGPVGLNEPLRSQWVDMAQVSPRAVILEAWVMLEQVAAEACKRHGLNLKSTELRTPIMLGQALEEAGILSGEKLGIFHQLRNLRNAAAHASEFSLTPEAAIEYADLAARLSDYLRNA